MSKAKNRKSPPKNRKISPLMFVVVVAGLLLATVGGFAVVSGSGQNRFAGIWHLQQAEVLPENSDNQVITVGLDSLESCTSPAQVTNNTPSPHFESQCFYKNISSVRRQAFKLYIFKNQDAKIRYYGSNLGGHPCRLGETPLIESDLYVMRPEANLARKQARVEGIYAKLKTFDSQAIMLQKGQPGTDYTSCDDHVDAIAQQYRRIGAGSPRIPDTAIDQRCSVLQASVDSVDTDTLLVPSNEAFADCLNLSGSVRRDFIDSLIVLEDQEDINTFASYGWYGVEGPVVEWYRFDTTASLALVAMHEYLHKAYFEDLGSVERIKVNQEILRLIDTDDPAGLLPAIVFPQEQWDRLSPAEKIALNPYGCTDTALIMTETGLCAADDSVYHNSEYSVFIDYLGRDSLNNEVMVRISRHNPSPSDFIRTRYILGDLEANISNRSQMIDEMLVALPAEIRQDYTPFLLDNYGLAAFMREVREVTDLEKLIKDLEEKLRERNEEETEYDSADLDSTTSEFLARFNYDKRLATIVDGNISLKERLEEIFLNYYSSYYSSDYGSESGYETRDFLSISQYIAQACGEGPECEESETQPEDSPSEIDDCDPDVDICDSDSDIDVEQLIEEYCEQNPEDEMCLLLEYCKPQIESGNVEDICYDVLEYCASNLQDELCRPDWSDKDYCYEDISNEECWPGFEEIIYDVPQTDDSECIELDAEGICISGQPSSDFPEIPSREGRHPILDEGIYGLHLDGIFAEGYPIIALEVKERLPSWLEGHFSQFLQGRQELADYFRRRS